jgi:hypothetical protein
MSKRDHQTPNPHPLQPIALDAAANDEDLFGPPPVISGEDPGAFLELLARVRAAVKPKDLLEDFFVRDCVDLIWEIRRLRRLMASLLQVTTRDGLDKVLTPLVGWVEADILADDWVRGRAPAIRKVDKLMAAAGLTREAIMAEALALRLSAVESFERMIASKEGRLQAALREVDRHRAALAAALRDEAHAVEAEDAEFAEVPPRNVAA